MVGADDRPRRGGGGRVRADNREIDDGEQGGGVAFVVTVHRPPWTKKYFHRGYRGAVVCRIFYPISVSSARERK